MNFIWRHKWLWIGITLGGIAGYIYYATIGCSSGTCSITSKPINSSLYGALMGGLLFSAFKKENKNSGKEK